MNFLLNESFASVWVDSATNCILASIRDELSQERLDLIVKAQFPSVTRNYNSRKKAFSVIDLKDCYRLRDDMAVQLVSQVVQPQFAYGLSFAIFILPQNHAARMSLLGAILTLPQTKVEVCGSLDEAKEVIRREGKASFHPMQVLDAASHFLLSRLRQMMSGS